MLRSLSLLIVIGLLLYPVSIGADNIHGFSKIEKSVKEPPPKEPGNPSIPGEEILLSGDCSDYRDLSGVPLPISVLGTTVGSTNDYGPYASRPGCWVGSWYAGSGAAADVTFRWTAPMDAAYTISLCGSGFDTCLEIYDFTCPDEPVYPDDYICGNDDACGLQSEISCIPLTEGQEILIVVDGYLSNTGSFNLTISLCGTPPENDDCSGYVDLSGTPLPVSVSGSTVGATNDYGPFSEVPDCWQGPFMPPGCASSDVTYKWTAPTSDYYTIEVCEARYDSDILVYNFTCPDEPVFPDDLICGNDYGFCGLPPQYSAGLQSIFLEGGQEILIVVDGFQISSGDFELAIYQGSPPPPPFECPENSVFSQPASLPTDWFSMYTSDYHSAFHVVDNLPDLSGSICHISFWGFDQYYSGDWQGCTEDPMEFQVYFLEDDNGYPGEIVCYNTITPTRTPTGLVYMGEWDLNHYEAILSPCCEIDGGWIAIRGSSMGGDPQNCLFIWLDSQAGDDICYQWDNGEYVNRGTSMSLCLDIGCDYVVGDYNGSGAFNVSDIISSFSKLKTGSPDPTLLCECPRDSGIEWAVAMDLDNSCEFNIADVIAGFSRLKTGAPDLVPCVDCPPPAWQPAPPGNILPAMIPSLIPSANIRAGEVRD